MEAWIHGWMIDGRGFLSSCHLFTAMNCNLYPVICGDPSETLWSTLPHHNHCQIGSWPLGCLATLHAMSLSSSRFGQGLHIKYSKDHRCIVFQLSLANQGQRSIWCVTSRNVNMRHPTATPKSSLSFLHNVIIGEKWYQQEGQICTTSIKIRQFIQPRANAHVAP